MASAESNVAFKKDWPFANPWVWLTAGLGFVIWSWLWALTFKELTSDYHVIVLAFGLLLAGGGLWLRVSDRQNVYLLRWPAIAPTLARLLMGGLFALLALGVTALWVATIIQWNDFGWKPGATTLIWLTVAPLSFLAARRAWTLKGHATPIDLDEEIGLAFVIAALTAGLGSLALYLGADAAGDWETMRMFLRVTTAVCVLAAGLMLVTKMMRRLVLSFVILLHFGGILTACLSAPPAPILIQQIWVRIYRPYLEFMYLNNAYHFYAPEPGPASYIWFRLIYTDENENEFGWWHKIPQVDDKGMLQHTVALEYQRFLAATESTSGRDAPPPAYRMSQKGFFEAHPFHANRVQLSTQQVIIGQEKSLLRIPLHPEIPQMDQIFIPNLASKRLLSSYARFVAHKYAKHPEKPTWTFKSVKVYRVTHSIPPVQLLNMGIPPTDPAFYLPYYMGNHDADGKLIEDGETDPYLYWLLPILRDNPRDPNSSIRDWARRHAGDPKWIRPQGETTWEDIPIRNLGADRFNPDAK